jgi:hypothetical protein
MPYLQSCTPRKVAAKVRSRPRFYTVYELLRSGERGTLHLTHAPARARAFFLCRSVPCGGDTATAHAGTSLSSIWTLHSVDFWRLASAHGHRPHATRQQNTIKAKRITLHEGLAGDRDSRYTCSTHDGCKYTRVVRTCTYDTAGHYRRESFYTINGTGVYGKKYQNRHVCT